MKSDVCQFVSKVSTMLPKRKAVTDSRIVSETVRKFPVLHELVKCRFQSESN